MPVYINEILLVASIFASVGIMYIIYARDNLNTSSRLYMMTMALIIGYLVSHGVHFLFLKASDVTILDQSCHSFLLLILLSLTFFSLYFPDKKRVNQTLQLFVLVPSLIMLFGLWSNWFLLESHSHDGIFEAHYTDYYYLFLVWYGILILINVIVLFNKYKYQKDSEKKKQIALFVFGLIFTNLIAASFGMVLPWVLGFYYLVEISPASFIAGVILFTTVGVGKYNLFPVVTKKLHSFSITKKVIFSALIVVPIIIILFQIPLGRLVLDVDSVELWEKYFILSLISGILVSITITFVIIKIIADPLNKIRDRAEEIKKGNFGILVKYNSHDEIGELAETFNSMSLKLKEDRVELKKQQMHISLLLKAIENSNAGICILNGDYTIIEANQKFVKFHSLSASVKKGGQLLPHYRDIMKENDFTRVRESLMDASNFESEIEVVYSENKLKTLLISITNFVLEENSPAFIIVEVDVTEIKQLERQLFETEKLAELGKMAAVLAHEIKTPLTSIKMNADILSGVLRLDEDERQSFGIIDREVKRLNNLAKEVLLYSKQSELKLENVKLKDIVSETISNVATNGKQIDFETKLNDEIIYADKEKIYQVIMNLIINSVDAIESKGKIKIYTEREGNSVGLFIEDSGRGIPEENQKLIFAPFITFKASGTGLGLAIARKIMEQHNFELTFLGSEPGKTIFCLKFKN